MEPIMTQIINILRDATKEHMRCRSSQNLRQRDLSRLPGWKRLGRGWGGPGLGYWEDARVSRGGSGRGSSTCPGPRDTRRRWLGHAQ